MTTTTVAVTAASDVRDASSRVPCTACGDDARMKTTERHGGHELTLCINFESCIADFAGACRE